MKQTNLTRNHSEAVTRGLVAATAARSYSWVEELNNDSGTNITEGQVVVVVADGTIELAATVNEPRPTGVALDDIDDGESGQVCFGGPVDLVAVVASVTAGTYGQTSTTPGSAQTAPGHATAFCEFTESGTTPSAFLWGGRGGGGLAIASNSGVYIEDLDTTETDTTLVLHPDGTGGTEWGVDATGGVPWSYAQADGGLAGDGVTDDTVAFQAWIDSVTASGTKSGWFFFEEGVYLIGGALQDTGAAPAFNAQILLPSVSTSDPQITLRFHGAARPPFAVHGGIPDPNGYAIIKSTLTGASGTAAVISGGNGDYTTLQNNVEVIVEDLICLAPSDPTFTFWNLSTCQGGAIRSVYISTTTDWVGTRVEPTHSNAYGIKLPGNGNSNYTYVDMLAVGGFYTGTLQGEWVVGRGMGAAFCKNGIELPAQFHASQIQTFSQIGCLHGINVTGEHYTDILLYDAERGAFAAWAVTTDDLYDPSDLMYGLIRYHNWTPVGFVTDHNFYVTGGANVTIEELGESPVGTPIGPAGGDLSGTYPNPSVVDDSHNHTASTLSGISGLLTVDPGTPTYDTSGADVVVTYASDWGYDADGPYYDVGGAASGEEAILALDPTTGELAVIPYNP